MNTAAPERRVQTTPNAELRIMSLAERLMAGALAISFAAVIVVGRTIDPFVLGPCTALATALVLLGPRLRSDTRLHLLLSLVFVIDVSLTLVYIDGYGVDIVWLFVLPLGAGLLGRWQHIAVWSAAVAVAFLMMFLASSSTHLVWHNPTTLPNLVGTSAILFLTGYAMLWSRRQREDELRDALVAARELAEKRARAERCARANEQARRRFLATMSHELRTPMAGMLLAADSIDTGRLSDADANTIASIRSSADSLIGLLNEVLDLARLERDDEAPRSAPFEIVSLVEGVAALAAPAAHDNGVSCVVDLPPSLNACWEGDEARLRRVLANLANHAVDHTPFGAIRVRVEATDTGLLFGVDDTGGGLDPIVAAAISDPVSQSEQIADALGTSLRLTIARDLVAAMGGTLRVDSQPLVGASFEFVVPLQPVGSTTVAQAIPAPSLEGREVEIVSNSAWAIDAARTWIHHWGGATVATSEFTVHLDDPIGGAEPSRHLQSLAAAVAAYLPRAIAHGSGDESPVVDQVPGRRCLVVDDDRIARTMIEIALQKSGHETVGAENGAEALQILDQERIDIMFVDLTMPVLDGLETIKRVRAGTSGQAALPICVVSGTSSEPGDVLAIGADRFLRKPPRIAELATAVNELVPQPDPLP